MRIKFDTIPVLTLEQLGSLHKLTMTISERSDPDLPRWYCSFDRVETLKGGILTGTFGNGNTPAEAMVDYAYELSGKNIVYDSYGKGRVNIGEVKVIPAPVWVD